MKRLLLTFLFCSAPAMAQAPQTTPAETALSQEIMECVGGKVQLRTRVNQLEAELARMKAEAAKPDAPAPK